MTADFEELLEKYKLQIGVGLVGFILVGIGIFSVLLLRQERTTVEILPVTGEAEKETTILVDLEGAVERPGVYELPAGARLNDLLIRAGGFSAQADRDWAAKNLNLAQKLADGVKIYVPAKDETTPLSPASESIGGQVAGIRGNITDKININTASARELDGLWGIGEKRAQKIIAHRPYSSIEELKTRKVIPSHVYERIKDKITVY